MKYRNTLSAISVVLYSAFYLVSGCSGRFEIGNEGLLGARGGKSSGGSSNTSGIANGGTAGVAGAPGGVACHITKCQNHVYQCGDCIDNDNDGLADSADPDCLGPCQNREDKFFGDIPGQNNAPCKQDCYWDQDSGKGNDDCNWSHRCDPLSVAPHFPPEGEFCSYDPNTKVPGAKHSCSELYEKQSAECLNFCGPLTPNGCDCFGCCELPANKGKFVWVGSEVNREGSCDLAHMDDPTRCKPCTPVKGCFNDCGHCELCPGKTTLPADCTGAGGAGGASGSGGAGGSAAGSGGVVSPPTGGTTGSTQCAAGIQPCGLPGQDACPVNHYCITGCCQPVIQ